MKMKNKFIVGAILLSTATAAYAASHTYTAAGPNQGDEVDASGNKFFWTVYARDWDSQSVTVNDIARRDISMDWDLKNMDSADYVGGGGWQNVATPNTLTYDLYDWTTSDGKGTFGAYGWSCGVPAGNLNVEYYIVEAAFGGWTPPTNAGEYTLTKVRKNNRDLQVVTNNGTYQIYQSGQINNQPSYCQSGNTKPAFKQVWAVRTANKFVQASRTNPGRGTIDFKVLKEVMDDYGYFNANSAYLVIGAEGLKNSKGHIRLRVNKT
ncbi:hypothetical protein ACFOWX_07805 [Sphingorhabdus arenilitoris]|uniref:Uncharacterized protein n=1 Tax=Sphingorhabdus arenilitoris TaxID=1490041 RepID=A0ABV8RG33_9SPHN